jgi:4-hydroxy-3-polyprenylbenzoate decarboxylase
MNKENPLSRPTAPRRILLALTGASAMPFAAALAKALSTHPEVELHGIISPGARRVLQLEGPSEEEIRKCYVQIYPAHDMSAPPSSGSWQHGGMIICPCSMATLGAIASGAGTHLVHRAADVTLKEGRPLIVVPRETPLSSLHLRNMLRLQRCGAVIMPPCPGFYHHPTSIEDLTQAFAGRVLEQLGIEHDLYRRWGPASQGVAPSRTSC